MTRSDWSCGDRRTDTFVVLLFLAPAIMEFLHEVWGWVVSGPPDLARLPTLGTDQWPGAARHLGHLWLWLTSAVSHHYGKALPVAVGVCGLARLLSVRSTVVIIAAYELLAATVAGSKMAYHLAYIGPHYVAHEGHYLLAVVTLPLGTFVPWCAMAAGATVVLLRRTRCADVTSARALAAALTRAWLFATAAICLCRGGIYTLGAWILEGLGVAPSVPRMSTSLPLEGVPTACGAVGALLLVACGIRLIRHGRITPWVIVAGLLADLGVWVSRETVTWIGLSLWRTPVGLVEFVRVTLTTSASTLPVSAAVLWYWWPVLRGRADAGLQGEPRCPACGYCLTGNVSGRCPECGTAVAEAIK